MSCSKVILSTTLFLLFALNIKAQRDLAVRAAINSGVYILEFGKNDIPHPEAEKVLLTTTSEKFKPQFAVGGEFEFLIEITDQSYLGVELEGERLKGYNDHPPAYNYYFSDENPLDTFVTDPVAFSTNLINLTGTWWFYLNSNSKKITPFIKVSGGVGVAFIGTDFKFKNPSDAAGFESDIIYTRGTKNDDRPKWPAAYLGGGFGLDYEISENVSFVLDGTLKATYSDIVNGVPNFNYIREELEYRNRVSMTAQFSAGIKYSWTSKKRPKRRSGRVHPNFPFHKIK